MTTKATWPEHFVTFEQLLTAMGAHLQHGDRNGFAAHWQKTAVRLATALSALAHIANELPVERELETLRAAYVALLKQVVQQWLALVSATRRVHLDSIVRVTGEGQRTMAALGDVRRQLEAAVVDAPSVDPEPPPVPLVA